MRNLTIIAAGAAALLVSACNSPQDKVAEQKADDAPGMEVRQNTSPAFPPVPQQAPTGMQGIETPSATDNLEGAPAP